MHIMLTYAFVIKNKHFVIGYRFLYKKNLFSVALNGHLNYIECENVCAKGSKT
jgi:hypothetical protein